MLVATRPYRIFAFGMIFQNCDAKIVTIIHFPKSPPQLLTKFEGVYMKGKFMKEGTGRVPAGDDIISDTVHPRPSLIDMTVALFHPHIHIPHDVPSDF